MNNTISLKRNFVMNTLLTISSFIFPLISFPYVSRVLLPTGTGKINFVTSIIAYFSMFAQMGIPTYGIRACAKVRDNREELSKTVQELLIINLIMNCVVYIVLAIAIATIPKLHEEKTLFILMSSSIILSSIGIEWLYKALEQYSYITIRSMIFKLISLALLFLFVHKKEDYVVYGAITIFSASASNILNLLNAHKFIEFRRVGNYNLKRHLKPIGVFFALVCAATIYTNIDNVMLGFMTSDADVGYYGAAVKIKTILVSIVTALGTVLLPRVSYYVEHGEDREYKRVIEKAYNFVILLALPLTIYFIFFAKEGILLLSGDAYHDSIVPMQVIMPTLIIIGISNILGLQILVPTNRERTVLKAEIIGAMVDIIINLALISSLRSTGAAIGTLVAEGVVLYCEYRVLRKEIYDSIHKVNYATYIVGIFIAALLSVWVKYLSISNFWKLAFSSMLFFGGYILVLIQKKCL